MTKSPKLYLKLFISTFYLSAFTFGGGYVIISIMKKKFVDELKWIDEDEMLNLTAIAQSSPGAVAVNASILVGYRIGGMIGTLVAVLGTILPPLIIISIISMFYSAFRHNTAVSAVIKGMQAGVAAVITDVVIHMGGNIVKNKEIVSIILMVCAFIASYFFDVNVIIMILICGTIGAVRMIYLNRRLRKEPPA